jgi:hypothetical protein
VVWPRVMEKVSVWRRAAGVSPQQGGERREAERRALSSD